MATDSATYRATKHGVLGQTKSIALQYGAHGVRVNAVCPGTIATPMVERMTASRRTRPRGVCRRGSARPARAARGDRRGSAVAV